MKTKTRLKYGGVILFALFSLLFLLLIPLSLIYKRREGSPLIYPGWYGYFFRRIAEWLLCAVVSFSLFRSAKKDSKISN
jgi:hypothetical protein